MSRRLFMSGCSALICVVIFSACNKVRDVSFKRFCNIEMMSGYTYYDTAVPRYFYYNEWGNPTRVAFDESPGTGTPFYDFFYDNNQRLVRFEEFSTHNFTYNGEGLIVVDTIFSGYAGGDFRFEEKFFYDGQKRIIKTISKLYRAAESPDAPPDNNPDVGVEHVTDYVYDVDGNLVRPGVTYDRKTNPRRTNKVWMFIDRDYSVNNPQPGPTRYNALGLPLNNTSLLGFQAVEVVYNCRVLEPPRK